MFKKLDKLIIKKFIGPFAATFFITLLVLVMQFFWLYIDDFVGKGIEVNVILEFILYQSAVLVPLALPLAVLLSSLMTFGDLGESFELVAIKSSGISLLRFMRPLFIASLLISCIAFLFSNYIIPQANLKSRTLLSDIVYAKPAFNLKEGAFYDKIPGVAIKVGKKEANDSIINDIIIYEQDNPLQDNFLIAQSGVMRVSENRRFLEFILKDGWRYQEKAESGTDNSQFIRIAFKEYKKQFDLGGLGFSTRTADSLNKNNERMYSIRQLTKAIDSLEAGNRNTAKQGIIDIFRIYPFAAYIDTAWTKQDIANAAVSSLPKKFDDLLPDSAKNNVNQNVKSIATSIHISARSLSEIIKEKEKNLNRHKIEWHRKITLSLACIVLFLIGAPLGSIIRKGGLGAPLIIAIIFFMIFYFTTTTGEKFAKENSVTPFMGMWLSTFILGAVGIFLTHKAMRESQLLNKEIYVKLIKISGYLFRPHRKNNSPT